MNLYFDEKYGKLYENHEKAELTTFDFENENGKIKYMFLKREVPYLINDTIYYDILTPYGYGGPIILKSYNKKQLLTDYHGAFSNYCQEHGIVSEFVRFHLIENEEIRKQFYGEVDCIGRHIVRDLSKSIEEDMSSRILRYYRGNKKKEIKTVYDYEGTYIDSFMEVYYQTLDKNNAQPYYYFDHSFFKNLNATLSGNYVYVHIFLDDLIIASELILFGDTYSYAFLKGTRSGYYDGVSNVNVNMEIDGMKLMKKKDVKYYIMGGGHNGEDGIYNFKKKFDKKSDFHYFLGKKIHNEEIYKKLVEQRFDSSDIPEENPFFPAYRTPESTENKNSSLDRKNMLSKIAD